MSPFFFNMLVLVTVAAGALITGIYLFMLAVPRNDDERTHDGLSEPDHMKTHVLKAIARLRRRLSR